LFASQQYDNGNQTTNKLRTARVANNNPDNRIACRQRFLNNNTMTATFGHHQMLPLPSNSLTTAAFESHLYCPPCHR
jgi:hypothetical protein